MKARKEEEMILTMSPVELRRLADKMEELWTKISCGDSTFVDIISYKPMVVLHLDQTYFHKLEEDRKVRNKKPEGLRKCCFPLGAR